MRLVLTPNGWDDHRHWRTADRATLERINRLVYLIDDEDVVILQARYHY